MIIQHVLHHWLKATDINIDALLETECCASQMLLSWRWLARAWGATKKFFEIYLDFFHDKI